MATNTTMNGATNSTPDRLCRRREPTSALNGEALLLGVTGEVVLPAVQGRGQVGLLRQGTAEKLVVRRGHVVVERAPLEVGRDRLGDTGEDVVHLLAAEERQCLI